MKFYYWHWVVALGIVTILLAGPTHRASAQAVPTAEAKLRLQTFGTLSYVRPDYGGARKNAGGTVGLDLNFFHIGAHYEPSIEARVLGSGGNVSREYNYIGGPRIEAHYGRFRPYADFLIGYGSISFVYPHPIIYRGQRVGEYAGDDAITYNFGGGLDYVLTPHWAVRADALQQNWHISPSQGVINPFAFSLGVRYRLLF